LANDSADVTSSFRQVVPYLRVGDRKSSLPTVDSPLIGNSRANAQWSFRSLYWSVIAGDVKVYFTIYFPTEGWNSVAETWHDDCDWDKQSRPTLLHSRRQPQNGRSKCRACAVVNTVEPVSDQQNSTDSCW